MPSPAARLKSVFFHMIPHSADSLGASSHGAAFHSLRERRLRLPLLTKL